MKGIVFEISEMSLADGSGVRVVVFMKGCPLRCTWCHNPEGLSAKPQLLHKKATCKSCGLCRIDCKHIECKEFSRCTKVCPNNSLTISGVEVSSSQLATKIFSYKKIFDLCGGGVTFSGGEPLMQSEFLLDTIAKLDGITIAIETSGYCDSHTFQKVVGVVDEIIFDIKFANSAEHKKYTSKDNEQILLNFEYLKKTTKNYKVRTPIIKGITDSEENINEIAKIVGDSVWEKIPENPLGKAKYNMFV